MSCIAPILVRENGRRDFVPCGKCNYCLQRKRADWTFRLKQEEKVSVGSTFLTLTYDDENVPMRSDTRVVHGASQTIGAIGEQNELFLPTLEKRDLQLFTKRLRKINEGFSDYGIRYYSVGEYGTRTNRPHYHSILFNVHPKVVPNIDKIWGLGQTLTGDVTTASIHYVTKYVINKQDQDFKGREPPFALMSTRPGIGSGYLQTHTDFHRAAMRNYVQDGKFKQSIPRYYKDKLFTDREKKLLSAESIALSDVAYIESVINNKDFHDDPYYYYDEARRFHHDRVHNKINDQDTF